LLQSLGFPLIAEEMARKGGKGLLAAKTTAAKGKKELVSRAGLLVTCDVLQILQGFKNL
jgi:hypothetical protein